MSTSEHTNPRVILNHVGAMTSGYSDIAVTQRSQVRGEPVDATDVEVYDIYEALAGAYADKLNGHIGNEVSVYGYYSDTEATYHVHIEYNHYRLSFVIRGYGAH